MKIFSITLLAILLILIAGFVSKKTWAPERVAVPTTDVQPDLSLKDGRQCYSYAHAATPESPYEVLEVMDLTISGTDVSGTKRGTQNGPDMTNGYDGTISGTLTGNNIDVIFSYIVEGSANKEKELYKVNSTGVEKLRYPLVQKNGMLVPDTTKPFTALSYSRITCSGSN